MRPHTAINTLFSIQTILGRDITSKDVKKIHYGLTDIWDLPQFCVWLLNPAAGCAIL